jgi:PII-like signaling protein
VTYFDKVLGQMTKYGVQSEVMKMSMLLPLVVIVVDKVFNVVMGTNVLNILK